MSQVIARRVPKFLTHFHKQCVEWAQKISKPMPWEQINISMMIIKS